MFEELAQGDDLSHVDDAAVVDAIAGWTRAEATVASHRLAAIAELTHRRGASDQAVERQYWACDAWDGAAAEIAVASGLSTRAASSQMHHGLALRDRLPQIAKLLAEGTLAARLAYTITWRTQLIEDPQILTRVDADLTATCGRFGALSVAKLENAVDAAIAVHDPAAVRRFRDAATGCDLGFGKRDDATGTVSMWGRLKATDAELAKRRIELMTRGTCPHDPRTAGEPRSAAVGVIGAGGEHLPCTCRRPDCTATGPDARAEAILIHILTDHHPDTAPEPEAVPTEPQPDAHTPASGLAVIAGGGIVPTALLTELVNLGAPVRPVPSACDLGAQPRYRPSATLQSFVRSRDLTCCFPGCERPAELCDVDHTTPHRTGGLTHPANTKCLCRKHHLLKTFWIGPTGWSDQQLADGTVVWITPTGHRHTRPPGSRLLFPRWDTTTPLPADTPTPPTLSDSPERGLTMPTRKTSRADDRTQRLRAERERNQRAIDEDPPPF